MINQIKNQYNSWYKTDSVQFGEGGPDSAVVKLSRYIDTGTVLDIGGGEGRNALYLANERFEVTVIDLSEVGLDKIKKVNKNIKIKVSDITKDKIEGKYDVVINSFVLHHLNEDDARKVILNSKKHTTVEGVNIIVTFSNKGGLYERNKKSGRFYPSKEVLRELYSDWEVKDLETYESTTFARDKNGNRMKNEVVTLTTIKKD